MNILRNGWTWAAILAVWLACIRTNTPPDVSGPLAVCVATQAATEAQVGGLMLQNMVIASQAERMSNEIDRANAWRKGAMHAISVLELKCRAYTP